MHFDTTGQGRVRINPNLYADGKVLSQTSTISPLGSQVWLGYRSALVDHL